MFDRPTPPSTDSAVNPSSTATSHVALADWRSIDRNGEWTSSWRGPIDSSDEREGWPQRIRLGEPHGGCAYQPGGRRDSRLDHLHPYTINFDEDVRIEHKSGESRQDGRAEN